MPYPLAAVSVQKHQLQAGAAAPTLPDVASATRLLDLRYTDLSLGAIATWPDNTSLHHDSTQSIPTARPALVADAGDGKAGVYFNGGFVVQWLDCGNFADNLNHFAVIFVAASDGNNTTDIISKLNNDASFAGWAVRISAAQSSYLQGETGFSGITNPNVPDTTFAVRTCEFLSDRTHKHYFINSNNSDEVETPALIADYSNNEPVRIGVEGFAGIADFNAFSGWMRNIMLYEITDDVNWPTNRAAIEAWLAAQP